MAKQNKKDYVSGEDIVIDRGVPVYVWGLIAAIVLVGLAVFLFGKPKALSIESLVPSGPTAFIRLDDVHEHLNDLRASGFWKGFSKVDVPKLLKHSELNTKAIEGYNARRGQMVGIIDHPLFKQFLGREVALVFYPIPDSADPLDWSGYASGILLVTRTEMNAQVTGLLANIWSRGNKDWTSEQVRYQNSTITAIHFEQTNLTVYYTRLRDLLFVSMNQSLVASSIDVSNHKNAALTADENFNAAAGHFYKAPDGVVYVDVDKARNFLNVRLEKILGAPKDAAEEGKESDYDRVQDAVNNLEGIRLSGLSFVAENPLKAKWDIILSPSKMEPDAIARYSCTPTENATLNLIPKDAVIYQWTNCFDFAAYYEKLKNLAEENFDHESNGKPFARLEETWGFGIERDILPILGRELGWFAEGVNVKGLFPVPRLTIFTKVKDEKRAGDILKKIVTTPVTLVQQEDYDTIRINFISIPLFASFRPSYAFVNGYLLIATSDELIKSSIDALKDPQKSLRGRPDYKNLNDQAPQLHNGVSFMDIGQVARQSRSVVDWTSKWFLLKIKQADTEEQAVRRNLEAVKLKIQTKTQEVATSRVKLEILQSEAKSLEAALSAAAVAAEATGTLDQPAVAVAENPSTVSATMEEMNLKKSEISALELEIAGIRREIEDLEDETPDLEDEIADFEQQKMDAENFHYFVEEVAVPLLNGLESLSGHLIHTTFQDKVIESEMFLDVK